MNRKEFMRRLRAELSRLPEEEKNAALEYYEEYFDEAGPEREQELIREMGSPRKVAGQIKSEYAMRMLDQEPKGTVRKGLSAVWWVIIGICSAPISIPLIVCLVAVAIAVFAVVISCIVAIFAAIIGAAATSVVAIALGVLSVPAAFSTSLLFIGMGVAGLGVLAALSVAVVLGIRAVTAAMVRSIRQRNEKRRLRNMFHGTGADRWQYQEDAAGTEDLRQEQRKRDSGEESPSTEMTSGKLRLTEGQREVQRGEDEKEKEEE